MSPTAGAPHFVGHTSEHLAVAPGFRSSRGSPPRPESPAGRGRPGGAAEPGVGAPGRCEALYCSSVVKSDKLKIYKPNNPLFIAAQAFSR